jgi:hypothetical protein
VTTFKTTIRCGDTLHVLVAGTAQELASLASRTASKLLRANGDAVQAQDGSSTWIVDEEVHPAVWHQDGNRVRAVRVQYHLDTAGKVSKQALRNVWISAVS